MPPPSAEPAKGAPAPKAPAPAPPRSSSPGGLNPFISDPGSRRPPGLWGRAAALLARLARLLVAVSRLGFSEAKTRGNQALGQFAARPEHTRLRVYAFGGYGILVAVTLLAQLWEPNSLQAYVKVEPVALPEATVIFVRNDSSKVWKEVRVLLNRRYEYQRGDLEPTRYISLPVDRFAVYDANGKATFAPKETVPRVITVECDRGRFELDLEKGP